MCSFDAMPADSPDPGLRAPDQACRLIRATLGAAKPKTLRSDGLFRLLWVQNGTARLHLVNSRQDLPEGTVLFLRPAEAFGLQARAKDTMIVSLELAPGPLAALRDRHPDIGARLFWGAGPDLETLRLGITDLAALNRAALVLEDRPPTALTMEALLVPLIAQILALQGDAPAGAPDWLKQVCAAARDSRVFREGPAGLVRLSGRSHAHVTRSFRTHLGVSPSDYITGLRMDHAARLLIGSDDPLPRIAEECGLPNLSHFHKLFRAAHGQTPARFRKAHQRR